MIEERQKQCHKERRRLTKIALNHARSAQKMCSKTFGCDYRQSKCSSPSWFRVSVTFQNHMQLSRHQRLTKMEHWHGREQMKNTTASIQFPLSEAALPANPRMILKMKVKSLSRVQLFATPWTVAHQSPPSMGIFQARILEWVAISFSRGSFPTQGSNLGLPNCRQTLYRLSQQGMIVAYSRRPLSCLKFGVALVHILLFPDQGWIQEHLLSGTFCACSRENSEKAGLHDGSKVALGLPLTLTHASVTASLPSVGWHVRLLHRWVERRLIASVSVDMGGNHFSQWYSVSQ